MSLFIKFILHEKPDTHVHKGMHCLENAVVNTKTPENMARLTAEERERERERERESYWYGAVGCELCP